MLRQGYNVGTSFGWKKMKSMQMQIIPYFYDIFILVSFKKFLQPFL